MMVRRRVLHQMRQLGAKSTRVGVSRIAMSLVFVFALIQVGVAFSNAQSPQEKQNAAAKSGQARVDEKVAADEKVVVVEQKPDSKQEPDSMEIAGAKQDPKPSRADVEEKKANGRSNKKPQKELAAERESRGIHLSIPDRMPDGRKLRGVGVFQSQIVDVVPRVFQPVSVERLSQAIRQQEANQVGGADFQLRSGFYDVNLTGDTLQSDHSAIDLRFRHQGSSVQSLGKVSFALTGRTDRGLARDVGRDLGLEVGRPATFTNGVLAEMESSSDGSLLAHLESPDDEMHDVSLDFSWEVSGRQEGIYRVFTLEIPPTTFTRIVLSTPADQVPETEDGVLQSFPGPPPGADVESRVGDIRWYSIDAGGLTKVRIRIRPRVEDDQSTPTLIRDQSLRYEISPAGIDWLHAITLQAPGGRALPEFRISTGEITAVKINNASVQFDQKIDATGIKRISVQPPISGSASTITTAQVSIVGTLDCDVAADWCDLPAVSWEKEAAYLAHVSSDVQVILREPLSMASWSLPPNWVQEAFEPAGPSEASDGTLMFRAKGPPIQANALRDGGSQLGSISPLPEMVSVDLISTSEQNGGPWSRVRVAKRPSVVEATGLVEFVLDDDATDSDRRVTARTRFDLKIDNGQTQPLTFQLEPSWVINSVSFIDSGRVIEAAALSQRGRIVTLWPESEDIRDGRLQIQCNGFRRVPATKQRVDLPEMWFVDLKDIRSSRLISIVPPENLKWTGGTAFVAGQVKKESLSDDELRFFNNVTEDALVFRSKSLATPKLSLNLPSVLIDVRTSLVFKLIQNEVHDLMIVAADTGSLATRELSIQTGASNGGGRSGGVALPVYRWSLHSTDGGIPINLPSTAVTVSKAGLYKIDLGETSLRGRRLVGRRQYPLDQSMNVQLPSVIGTASQEADVIIGSGLQLNSSDASVQRVPISQRMANELDLDRRLATVDPETAIRLQYEAVKKPAMVISKQATDPSVSLVWQQQIDLTASSRGTDLVRGVFQVSSKRPIRIFYEPDLRLVSLSHNDEAIDLAKITERPIVLQPLTDRDTIRVVWSRESIQRAWLRRCRIPEVFMEGVQVKASYRMKASADTFALGSLLFASESTADSGLTVSESRIKLLVHRDHALASGWLFALLIFGGAWAFARRALLALAAVIMIASVAAVLWWPWHSPLIGWVVLPMVAAALLESTLQWNLSRRSVTHSKSTESDSTEFSVLHGAFGADGSASKVMGILIVIASLMGAGAVCDADEIKGHSDIQVLVPVDAKENRVGDKVYVPGSFYQELFQANDLTQPNAVSFLSASYLVDLESVASTTETVSIPTIEADFTVHVRGSGSVTRLPLRASTVRRIEVLQEDSSRIVRFSPDEQGTVLAALPTGERLRLRVILVPTLTQLGESSRLVVAIPRIASSRVLVESDRTIDEVNVVNSVGAVTVDRALRRWDANLGPVAEMEIQFAASSLQSKLSQPVFRRRYFVNVGKSMTHIDCQVELPSNLQVGDEAQFIVLDKAAPIVTSAAWRLVRADVISASRQRVTVVKLADVSAPLELLWSRPSLVSDATSLEDRQSMTIPEVTPIASGPYQAAWIAIKADPDLRVTRIDQGETTELTMREFQLQWYGTGFLQDVDQSLIAMEALPSIVALQNQTAKVSLAITSHLHAGATECQIDFRAVVAQADSVIQRRSLRVPRNVRLSQLTIDGVPVLETATPYPSYLEFALGDLAGTEPVVVQATGTVRIPRSRVFSLPQPKLWPETEASHTYTLTRDANVKLEILQQPNAIEIDLPTDAPERLLDAGQVLVAHWQMNSVSDDPTNATSVGRLKASSKNSGFSCSQSIQMDYVDGRWQMQSEIAFAPGQRPSFIDLEIPTRWCDSLNVSPKLVTTQHTSTNASLQIVRIACDPDKLIDSGITIRSELSASDPGRVSVPNISVLGKGKRQTLVSLPNRLTTEPVQWEARGVSSPRESNERFLFDIESRSWSIELATMSDAKSDPIALAADSRVFLQGDQAVVATRWDLVPNGLNDIVVRLPAEAECLGAWSAGRSVAVKKSPSNDNEIQIPLSLSRLSQSVEVLLRVPVGNGRRTDYLPQLTDMEVSDRWMAVFSQSALETAASDVANSDVTQKSSQEATVPDSDVRSIALANAVVEAIDQSLDTLAGRSADEVATWLLPWMSRYQNISSGSARLGQFSIAIADKIADAELESTDSQDRPTSGDQQWIELDEKMQSFANRFLTPDQADQIGRYKPLFDAHQFDGYQLTGVAKVTPLEPSKPIEVISPSMNELRTILTNLLTLLMAAGGLWLLRPFRVQLLTVCRHPAFWLGVVGVLGLFVAPISVSLALILVAVTLPIMPRRKTG